jgi:hypothetical protein
MKVAGGGFEQCYNAQAVVDTKTMRVVAPFFTQAPNDKQQIQPALDKIAALSEGLNAPQDAAGGYRLHERAERDCLP